MTLIEALLVLEKPNKYEPELVNIANNVVVHEVIELGEGDSFDTMVDVIMTLCSKYALERGIPADMILGSMGEALIAVSEENSPLAKW